MTSETFQSIPKLIISAINTAFEEESKEKLKTVEELLTDYEDICIRFGARYLPLLPDLSWHLNTGRPVKEEHKDGLVAGRFELMFRGGTRSTAPYSWRDFNWEIRGRDNDIVAWRFI